MKDNLDDFISESVDILVNIAKQEDLKRSLNKLKSMPIEELSDFADMITRVYKDDSHGKMERFISICNCSYIALNTSIKEYKEKYNQLYRNCRNRY